MQMFKSAILLISCANLHIRRYSHFIWWFGLQLYKAALGNCFEIDDWGPIEFSIMANHFDRQGKPPYAYHAVRTCTLVYIPFTNSSRTHAYCQSIQILSVHMSLLPSRYASLMYTFSVFSSNLWHTSSPMGSSTEAGRSCTKMLSC